MKKTIYHIQYFRLGELYRKLNSRLNKHFSLGRFYKFTKRQQYKLLKRLEKVKIKLLRLEQILKLSGSAMAVGLFIDSTDIQAQTPKAGNEFRVDKSTPSYSTRSSAMDSNGDFVIVWQGAYNNVYAQLYDFNGTPQGTQITIPLADGDYPSIAVAMDRDGDFVITYGKMNGTSPDVYARRYNAAGLIQGSEFRVNTYTSYNQYFASVAMDSDGDFVITWVSPRNNGTHYGIYAQRYNSSGIAQGTEFQVNTYTSDTDRPDIAMDDIGNFVITWESTGQDWVNSTVLDADAGIYAQRFDAAGTFQGAEFRVNTLVQDNQTEPSIAMDGDGDFVIAWGTYSNAATPTTVNAIKSQRFNASGIPQGTEFQVNNTTTFGYAYADVAADNDGDFVVTWTSYNGQDGNKEGVYAKRFNSAGAVLDNEFQVNTFTYSEQAYSSIAMDSLGEYVISWQSRSQDVSGSYSVYAKRYVLNQTPVISKQVFSIAEDSNNGTSLGTITASDPDVGQTLTYTIIAGNTAGKFAINSSTGEIKVTGLLDYETVFTYALTVQVTDNGNPSRRNSAIVIVNITNVREAPVATPQNFSVTENSATGTVVGTLHFPVDSGLIGTYAIIGGNTGNAFAINSTTGVITVTGPLDYETLASYALSVQITDNGSPALNASTVINIAIIDANEAPLISPQTFSIAENSANGISIGTVLATDPDLGQTLTYSITGGNTGNAFAIDNTTGVITLTGSLDYETLASYVLTIKVMDNGSPVKSTSAIIAVNIVNVNEAPVITSKTYSIAENSQDHTFLGKIIASDPDLGQTLNYSILSGNIGNVFNIDNSGSVNTGYIEVVGLLDYETISSYTLIVQVTDNGIPSMNASAVITINITDVIETPVIIEEFKVNTTTYEAQIAPVIAMDDNGDFVIAWSSKDQDGNGYGIYAQRYTAGAVAVGPEFQVNTYTMGDQNDPFIAMNSTGEFVITWSSFDQDGNGNGVYAQRYNSMGIAQGGEFQVNTFTTNAQFNPSVAMNDAGGFVITWTSDSEGHDENWGVYAQRYNASGIAQGTEFNVNTYIFGSQGRSSIAMNSIGNFVITWTSSFEDGSGSGIYAQRYNALGVAMGAEFRVNTRTNDDQDYPAISMDDTGDFIIVWQGVDDTGSYYTDGIFAQRYTASGAKNGGEFEVNTYTKLNQKAPSVAMNSTGDFVVTWQSEGQDNDKSQYGIYAQLYNASGVAQGSEFPVNTFTIGFQQSPFIAIDSSGDFAISWMSDLQDGSDFGIYARWYSNTAPTISAQKFSISENSADGTSVGTVAASDPDAGQVLSYSIIAGNGAGKFTINSATGEITLVDGLNYATTPSYNLTIEVTDNGSPVKNNSAVITINVTKTTGIFSGVDSSPILIYPNPAKQFVQIEVTDDASIRVFNMSGQIVRDETLQNKILNVEDLKSGVYMVEITQNGATSMQKLVIE
jgi:hypothetical protein